MQSAWMNNPRSSLDLTLKMLSLSALIQIKHTFHLLFFHLSPLPRPHFSPYDRHIKETPCFRPRTVRHPLASCWHFTTSIFFSSSRVVLYCDAHQWSHYPISSFSAFFVIFIPNSSFLGEVGVFFDPGASLWICWLSASGGDPALFFLSMILNPMRLWEHFSMLPPFLPFSLSPYLLVALIFSVGGCSPPNVTLFCCVCEKAMCFYWIDLPKCNNKVFVLIWKGVNRRTEKKMESISASNCGCKENEGYVSVSPDQRKGLEV